MFCACRKVRSVSAGTSIACAGAPGREIVARRAVAAERGGRQMLRAVETDERDTAGLVHCDALGMAEARNGDGLAVVDIMRRGEKFATSAYDDRGTVFDAALDAGRQRCGPIRKTLEGSRHRGGDRPHHAFSRLIVEDGDAAQLAAARLHADDEAL